MRLKGLVQVVDSHTGGHPTRVVLGGLPRIYGASIRDKQDYFSKHLDEYRVKLIHEPRGHAGMFAAIVAESGSPEADCGLIFASTHKYLNMCGHGTIGAVTVLLNLGILQRQAPETRVVVEVPAGLIEVRARVDEEGRVTGVAFENVPSHVMLSGVSVPTPSLGDVRVDVAYGGLRYALIDESLMQCSLELNNLTTLMSRAMEIKNALNTDVLPQLHPGVPEVDSVLIYRYDREAARAKSLVVLSPIKFDRSPCGTGTSALAALLFEKGHVAVGDSFINEGPTGTEFKARIAAEAPLPGASDEVKAGAGAIIPEISGAAYITGFQQLLFDEDDPLEGGFLYG